MRSRQSARAQTAKVLADAVIPNEYGIDPGSKLRIGSKICCALLGKLLADLANMREESLATAVRTTYWKAFGLASGGWLVCRKSAARYLMRAHELLQHILQSE